MNRALPSAVLAASLFVGGCASSHEPVPQQSAQGISEQEDWLDGSNGYLPFDGTVQLKHEKISADLAAAEYVASKTHNPLAQQIVAYEKAHAVPSVVTKLGPVAIKGSLDPGDFFVVSLADSDKGVHPIVDDYLEASANGVYVWDLRTLFEYERADFSKEWLGILTLHEMNHAKNNLTHDQHDPQEEVKTRIFQHELAAELFGAPYTELVEKTMNDIRTQFKASFNGAGAFNIPEIDTASIVRSSSPAEARFANSTVLFDSIFKLIDENIGHQDIAQYQEVFDAITSQLPRGTNAQKP